MENPKVPSYDWGFVWTKPRKKGVLKPKPPRKLHEKLVRPYNKENRAKARAEKLEAERIAFDAELARLKVFKDAQTRKKLVQEFAELRPKDAIKIKPKLVLPSR